jgi:DNA-binding transcriptional MocR family regulator
VAIETRAAERGVAVLALSKFYAVPPKKKGLLLGFCGFREADLELSLGILISIMI